MDMEFKNGQINHNMKENGRTICLKEMECLLRIMGILWKVSGIKVKHMDMLSILNIHKIIQKLKTNTKESGKMERSMAKDLKYGRMELNSKECMKTIKKVELDNCF